MGLELFVAGIGGLHDAVPDDAWNDAAYGGERQEERLGVPGPPHQPPPRLALLPQYRHLSLPHADLTPPSSLSFF